MGYGNIGLNVDVLFRYLKKLKKGGIKRDKEVWEKNLDGEFF